MHVDVKYLPQMPDETQRRYLFVAIDRATRWVFVQIHPHKTVATAQAFLTALSKTAPFKLRTLFTDNVLTASGILTPLTIRSPQHSNS